MRFETQPTTAELNWHRERQREGFRDDFRPDGEVEAADPSIVPSAEVPAGSDLSQDRTWREMFGETPQHQPKT